MILVISIFTIIFLILGITIFIISKNKNKLPLPNTTKSPKIKKNQIEANLNIKFGIILIEITNILRNQLKQYIQNNRENFVNNSFDLIL